MSDINLETKATPEYLRMLAPYTNGQVGLTQALNKAADRMEELQKMIVNLSKSCCAADLELEALREVLKKPTDEMLNAGQIAGWPNRPHYNGFSGEEAYYTEITERIFTAMINALEVKSGSQET